MRRTRERIKPALKHMDLFTTERLVSATGAVHALALKVGVAVESRRLSNMCTSSSVVPVRMEC